MAPVTFRAANENDLPAIVTMLASDTLGQRRENPALPLDARYRTAFVGITADPNQLLAVAEQAGQVIGCLQITFIPGLSRLGSWRGLIEAVRIAPEARNRGTGRDMLRWAVAQCRARGCGLVQLTTDRRRVDAQRFYEALGFVPSHVGMKLPID